MRIVSYNVLSSSLSSSSYFVNSLDKHCVPKYRLDKLLAKLDKEVGLNSIVCLQEVSLAWTGRLHAYFAAKEYTFINSNYGNRNNNFMGVAIAVPRKRFAIKMVDLSVISDTKSGGWNPPRPSATASAPAATPAASSPTLPTSAPGETPSKSSEAITPWDSVTLWFKSLFAHAPDCAPLKRSEPPLQMSESAESWNLVKSRFNVMVSVRLRQLGDDGATGGEDDANDFILATYHVPCVFWNPAAMTICCALAAQRVQSLTEGRLPYVLAGDFNVKPNSPSYSLLTTGAFAPVVNDPLDDKVHGKPSLPSEPCFPEDKWTPSLPRGPMQSAYAVARGKEPLFTNYAKTSGMDSTFESTIDYIFFANGTKFKGKTLTFKVTGVLDLDDTCAAIKSKCVSLPNEEEPSDHLLIAAEFELEAVGEEA